MANTYKSIVITPNKSSNTADPNISFRGGNTTANTTITMTVYPDANGTLSFDGNVGQLFSITNDLSNSIFAVSDVSGIPSIEVFANGAVILAGLSGNVGIGNSAPAHKLVVNGTAFFGNTTVNSTYSGATLGFYANSTVNTIITAAAANSITINGFTAGYLEIPQNSQSAAYGTVLADSGKHILHPASDNNARTFTIPANSNVAYPTGAQLTFINMANTVTIAITTDTMYLSSAGTTGSRTLAAFGRATAIKINTSAWVISGTGLT